MSTTTLAGRYSRQEELANAMTHGAGLLLSIAGLGALVVFSAKYGDMWNVVSSTIYGTTLVLLYGTSTLYHAAPAGKAKLFMGRLDHAAIFLLIAGSYTPFTLVSLRSGWGLYLFAVVWSIAIGGVALELLAKKRYMRLSISLYLGLGWIILLVVTPMQEAVAADGLMLLLAGGICYTVGVIFYVWRTLPYHHAIWHLFVIAASALQFFSVFFYVVPRPPAP